MHLTRPFDRHESDPDCPTQETEKVLISVSGTSSTRHYERIVCGWKRMVRVRGGLAASGSDLFDYIGYKLSVQVSSVGDSLSPHPVPHPSVAPER